MTRIGISFAVTLLSIGCADHVADLGPDLLRSGISPRPERRESEPVIILQTVCADSASNGWVTACIFDSEGHNWDVGGDIPIFPLQPPYGFSFSFDADVTLDEADLTTKGPDAAVKAYAAAADRACELAEDSEENRVSVRAVTSKEGGLMALVDEAQPEGTQLVFLLHYGALLRNHVPLPSDGPCESREECDNLGYAARLYVGAEPIESAALGTANAVGDRCN